MGNVAFIGTGGMGQGVAFNLLKAGQDRIVCSRTLADMPTLPDVGATLVLTRRRTATRTEVMICVVGDNGARQEASLGPDAGLGRRQTRL